MIRLLDWSEDTDKFEDTNAIEEWFINGKGDGDVAASEIEDDVTCKEEVEFSVMVSHTSTLTSIPTLKLLWYPLLSLMSGESVSTINFKVDFEKFPVGTWLV